VKWGKSGSLFLLQMELEEAMFPLKAFEIRELTKQIKEQVKNKKIVENK